MAAFIYKFRMSKPLRTTHISGSERKGNGKGLLMGSEFSFGLRKMFQD